MDERDSGEPANVPEVDADRCVLSRVVAASCRACIDACPRDAFIDGDEALVLDTEACDGCAICTAACPQGAIVMDRPAVAVSSNDGIAAFAACREAVTSAGRGVMPCLHAIGVDELAGLAARGVRHLVLAHADCAACKPALHGGPIDQGIADVQRLLADRGKEPMQVTRLAAPQWRQQRDEAMVPSRRGFLLGRVAVRPQAAGPQDHRVRAGLALPASGAKAPVQPFVPSIDSTRCTACDACARICPEAAIRLEADNDTAAYVIEPARCSGCKLCLDVCDQEAVRIDRWGYQDSVRLHLDTRRCASCGNAYRELDGSDAGQRLCRICAATRPNQHLFQVIKDGIQ